MTNSKSSPNLSTAAILSTPVQAPLLVSPITVSRQTKRSTGATKKGMKGKKDDQNYVRQQWIANLKKLTDKKRMAQLQAQGAATNVPTPLFDAVPTSNQGMQDHSHPNVLLPQAYTMRKPIKSAPKSGEWAKTILKKRNNDNNPMTSVPRPRTPRRKLNCGSFFEEPEAAPYGSNQMESSLKGAHGLDPSLYEVNSQADFLLDSAPNNTWWNNLIPFDESAAPASQNQATPISHVVPPPTPGPELEFDFDTRCLDGFLDLSAPQQAGPAKSEGHLGHPELIRTDSAEQHRLSQYFEHTHIDRMNPLDKISEPAIKIEGGHVHFEDRTSAPIVPKVAERPAKDPYRRGSVESSLELRALLEEDCRFGDIEKELDGFYLDHMNGLEPHK